MKCIHCGKEINTGSVYCEHCGKAAQIVPDYNVLEEELISSMIETETAAKDTISQNDAVEDSSSTKKQNIIKQLWSNKKLRIPLILSWVLILLVIIFSVYHYQTSYKHQYSLAQECDTKKDYEAAIEHYQKAIDAKPDSLKARCAAGADYILLEKYDQAESILLEAVSLDSSSTKAFQLLLQMYLTTEAYDKITALEDMSTNSEVLALFTEYVVTPPGFSQEAGDYSDDLLLELSGSWLDEIYYTTNGKDPSAGYGIRYQAPIELKDGTTTVKSCTKNSDGNYSQVITKKYTITYEAPGYAVVNPASGTYTTPTQITMEAGELASIYYTWDGSVPSASSNKYEGPIDMPEGNNVLSVLVIDKHGLCSDILRYNYKYMP